MLEIHFQAALEAAFSPDLWSEAQQLEFLQTVPRNLPRKNGKREGVGRVESLFADLWSEGARSATDHWLQWQTFADWRPAYSIATRIAAELDIALSSKHPKLNGYPRNSDSVSCLMPQEKVPQLRVGRSCNMDGMEMEH